MTPLRIGTWNIERAVPTRKEGLLARIHAAGADIWVLTETRDSFVLDGSYHAVHSDFQPDTLIAGHWVMIWSRLPCIDRVPTRDPIRTAAALYDTSLGKVLVYGTVLPWHSDGGPSGDAPNWTEQHRVISEQAEEWSALRSRYPDAALCVAGDLNMNLGGEHYYGTGRGRQLLHEGLQRASLACVTRTEHVPEGKLTDPHIDHVCLPQAWADSAVVVDAWPGTIDGVRLTDHSALVVEVHPAT
jgi:hypothetical protein